MGGRKRSAETASNIGEAADGARESDVRGRRSRGGRAGIASDLGNEPTTTSQAAGSMPPPCADAYVPGSTASRSSGPGSGIASTSPAYAKLQRLSTDVPATSSLPDEISLPEPGSLRALTVGRHAHKNDVMLDCKLVPSLLSRQHAEIHCDTEGVHYVMDKNTLNGTYLNGNLIPTGPVPLKDGDVIAFGGPTNVLRDNMTHKNSFRFIYRCPKNVEQWRAAVQACSDAEAAANATPTADARDAAPPETREGRRRLWTARDCARCTRIGCHTTTTRERCDTADRLRSCRGHGLGAGGIPLCWKASREAFAPRLGDYSPCGVEDGVTLCGIFEPSAE